MAQKASHYDNHHQIVLKPTIMARFFTNFNYKMSIRIYQVCIKCSMCDLSCDVITCVWSCDMGKINASDKIMFKNQKKMRKCGINIIFT